MSWVNGLAGKIDRLLIPLSAYGKQSKVIKKFKAESEQINSKRNAIVHQGEFCNEDEAKAAIQQSREFIEKLVKTYEPSFRLKDNKC